MKKMRDPGSPRVGGFWPWESLLSRILSGSRLEPWLEPLTLPAGAPWIFLIFFHFFDFFDFFFRKTKKINKKILIFLIFFEKAKKRKKSKKIKKMKKIRDPGSPRVGGFWPWESLLSRILSGSRLEPWLEPLTLPAGAPWIFLIFFIFLIFLIFSKRPKNEKNQKKQ